VLALGAGLLLVNLLPISFESPVAYVVLLVATGIALLNYDSLSRTTRAQTTARFAPSDTPVTEPVGETEL